MDPRAPDPRALALACEERLVNVWPAPSTLMIGGFAVRFANGYSGRANSASAVCLDADCDEAAIAQIVALYRAAGLVPAIRVTPVAAAGFAARIEAAGFLPAVRSTGMIGPAIAHARDSRVAFSAHAEDDWLAGVTSWQEARKRNVADFRAIVGAIRLPCGFATIRAGAVPAGYGLAVIDRGMVELGSIMIAPEHRGRGFGRALVASLIGWGAAEGAKTAFLQVEAGNETAIALYRSLGFRDLYDIVEYRLPG